MLKIQKLVAVSVLLIMAALISGCYTIVGYPPELEESIIEEEAAKGQIYRNHEYYYDRPYSYYYRDYYDPYYGFGYPYSYYRDYPWWYDDYYYWDYDGHYVPQKKPDTKKRGTSELRRTPSPERGRGSKLKEDEEKKQIQRGQETENKTQRSKDSTPSSRKRSTRREYQDEE